MGMYDAPGTTPANDPYLDFEIAVNDMFSGLLAQPEIDQLKTDIQNSTILTQSQKNVLLSEFGISEPLATTTPPAVKAAGGFNFMQWYKDNLVVISLIQWAFIFILLIRKSN